MVSGCMQVLCEFITVNIMLSLGRLARREQAVLLVGK